MGRPRDVVPVDEVVVVEEVAVLQVEGIAAAPVALGDQHALGTVLRDLHVGGDPVGTVADVGCGRLRNPTAPGLKHPVPAGRHAVRVGTDEAVQGVVQRQHVAGPGFGEPARDHRLQACRLLLRQVVHFVEVLVQVVEFPPVSVEL